MQLLVTTHGETLENIGDLLQGQQQGTLSPHGRDQAHQISTYLLNRYIDFIYTSCMGRCTTTAEIIAQTHPEATLKQDRHLNARSLGIFEGKKKSDVLWSTLDGDFFTNRPSGGETLPETWDRIGAFYAALRTMPKESTLLAIAHGETAVLLGGIINGYDLCAAYHHIVEPKKAEISEYEIYTHGQNRTILTNHSGHLSSR